MSLCLTEQQFVYSGPGDRFTKNIAALRLLRELETSGRSASDAERLTLAHYSAFGESALLNRLFHFDSVRSRFVLHPDYAALLSEHEAKQLRRAALTAFYTPLDVVCTIWHALERLGLSALDRPRIIEPAAGVGHFISAMPPALRARAEITAVELDSITARILRHIHPDISIHGGVGFETVDLPTNWFDLAISNVPFGEMGVHDPLICEEFLRRTLHDYFFAKALRIVRPGGLVVFLTSWGTMDKRSRSVRAWLAEQAELIGAFRLPNGIFHQTSGSASATDLLLLQKRPTPTSDSPAWLELAEADYPHTTERTHLTFGSRYTREIKDEQELAAAKVAVNRLWLDAPERVIGTPTIVINDHSLWLQVTLPSEGVAPLLASRMEALLPCDIVIPGERDDTPVDSLARQPRDLYARQDTIDLTSLSGKHHARAVALAAIEQVARTLIRDELDDAPDELLMERRASLNRVYDDFVACYGVISDPVNVRLFKEVPALAFLLALEHNPRKAPGGWRADKERIFFERTLRPRKAASPGSLTPLEALLRCLDQIGELDMVRVAASCAMPVPQLIEALRDRIFRIPGTQRYELADAYLSGNVRAKLREARAWAERDRRYQRNVAALEAVQPVDLGPGDIRINLNACWLPGDVVTAFITELLPAFQGRARYDDKRSEWLLVDPGQAGANAVEAGTKWGTRRANAIDILAASLKGSPIVVYDEITVGDTTKRILNPAETVAAQEKQHAIITTFRTWVWSDGARAERLCTLYNQRYNNVRIRLYDGRHLTFPGMATHILRDHDLADYQKGAVWQILQNPTALIAFAVGGGKTFTAIAAAVEAKRMGLIAKALVVVPNTLVGQWALEARRLYPGIRVLAMAPEDFERCRRGIVLSRIATGDWDLIVIGHTSFKFLPLGAELLDAFHEQETDRLRCYLEELRATSTTSADKRSLKQIEKAIACLEERLNRMALTIARDSEQTIAWCELGVDMLIVDESQEFKNLFVPTKLTNIAGLPSAHSQRALDMRMKTWDLIRHGGKVVFLTATPIMNTLGEAYVMQLYLQEQQLASAGIHHLDEWISLYAEPRMAFEMKPDGSGFRMHTRLASFVNFPEMAAMWRQVLNVRTKEQMRLPEPTLVSGKLIPVVVPPSVALTRYIQSLAARVEEIRGGTVDPSIDNMLKLVGDGRKAALDLRLIVPGARRPHHSKIVELVKRVTLIYETYAPLKGTQLIFCDLATPKGKADRNGNERREHSGQFAGAEPANRTSDLPDADEPSSQEQETAEEQALSNFVYHEIRDELMQRGIPAAEIAFIHDYKTKVQRDTLFAAMNAGQVRVLIGSTGKMSTGMNVQQRLIALHDLDCPWRPGDLEQRHGRILRQGNGWPQVYIFTYITEGSFDAYSWQTVESKARFIAQALCGEVTARTVEDTDELVLSAAEVKAIASGNPKVVRKVQLETELGRMERVRAVWMDTRVGLVRERARAEAEIASLARRRAVFEQAERIAAAHSASSFTAGVRISVLEQSFTPFEKRAEAGTALRDILAEYEAAADFSRERVEAVIGHYRGLTIHARVSPGWGAEVRLCLVDGEALDHLNFQTEAGVFASADSVIRALPWRLSVNQSDTQQYQQRIAAIDAERERMAEWDGQVAYDAARAELEAINAEFAEEEAAEEAARQPRQSAQADTTSTVANVSSAEPAAMHLPSSPRDQSASATDIIAQVRALLTQEEAASEVDVLPATIPPALEALAFMRDQRDRMASSVVLMTPGESISDTELVLLEVVTATPDAPDTAASVKTQPEAPMSTSPSSEAIGSTEPVASRREPAVTFGDHAWMRGRKSRRASTPPEVPAGQLRLFE